MTIQRTSNCDARHLVQNLIDFNGNNTYARTHYATADRPTELYIVYSYGEHFPMFIAETFQGITKWYENGDKYSRTTSKQKTQLHPHYETTTLSAHAMRIMSAHGIAGVVLDSEKEMTWGQL